jgi:8-oxo-dGTP pyrophosphatase MutT (NUDIX family)
MSDWVIEKRVSMFRTGIFELKKLSCTHPGKNESHDFFIINAPDWVNVVALDMEGNFITVHQHRLGTDERTIETPAGLIEPGEDPLDAARRELLEETGYEAETITLMRKLSANPAIMNNYIYFFKATGCRRVAGQNLDRAEDIEVRLYPGRQIRAMLESGAIDHSIIVTALGLFFGYSGPEAG